MLRIKGLRSLLQYMLQRMAERWGGAMVLRNKGLQSHLQHLLQGKTVFWKENVLKQHSLKLHLLGLHVLQWML